MEQDELQSYINEGFSIRGIAAEAGKSVGSVKYWLNKYNLKTKVTRNIDLVEKKCNNCGIVKPVDEFYQRSDGKGALAYCRPCSNTQTIERQRKLKADAVEYLGGACSVCSYDKCHAAMEFHHLDPNEKDFTISHVNHTTFDKIKEELDKCILLCCNCHREIHFKT